MAKKTVNTEIETPELAIVVEPPAKTAKDRKSVV